MSDQNFPMPKMIGDLPAASPRDYAPKRGLEAVAEAVAPGAVTVYRPPPYTPTQPGSQHTATIKDAIKKLTHREMREMVAAIFAAHKAIDDVGAYGIHKEIGPNDNIPMGRLADVLDRFAYGE